MRNLYCRLYIPVVIFIVNLEAQSAENITREYESEYYKIESQYEVIEEKVDPATFLGWNYYHGVCIRCHGLGGTGTEIAPNLLERVKRITPAQFNIKVLHQYAVKFTTDDWIDLEESMYKEILKQAQRDRGEIATMPKWENNPAVRDNVDNIYRYLKARSDGVLGPDKPKILKDQ